MCLPDPTGEPGIRLVGGTLMVRSALASVACVAPFLGALMIAVGVLIGLAARQYERRGAALMIGGVALIFLSCWSCLLVAFG